MSNFVYFFSLWGIDHDFTMEEVLSEIAYFRGESYHMIRECGEERDDVENCIRSNFSDYATMVRSACDESIDFCKWNDKEFDCCAYFRPLQTELGTCYALNSIHIEKYEKIFRLLYSFLVIYIFRFISVIKRRQDLI